MFERETVNITSQDGTSVLDTWYYKPLTEPPYPLVVAGPGMTVIKEAGLSTFGEEWASKAGFASLIFDYRGFGSSGGEPRDLVDLEKQYQDYQSVIQWARGRPELFRLDKIVVVGTAVGGLTAARLVLEDPSLAGGIGQSPMLDGYTTLMALPFNPRLVFLAMVDTIMSKLGLSPLFIKAVGHPNEFALLNTKSAYPGFEMMFSQGSIPFSKAPNKIAPRLSFQIMGARPGIRMKEAKGRVLIVSSQDDDMIPIKIAREIAASAPNVVTLVESPGGHFDILKGGQGYETNINAQIEFLRSLL
ncbi:hypothetical protein AMATHDRAFT_145872 [Amanita thiersii Skay4041]|uniref:Serine aminopeptidase S33 domain-containing protein n=1 Tax=Amanita thiersii Skay4041 TaxID=703135 RepID=A0A2A9NQT0_9AGAR|nr:hypothetical protein AMATHDRAFT_145872 [Amanita thiersii Skay4041]